MSRWYPFTLLRFVKPSKPARLKTRQSHTWKPAVERLEDRTLLSGQNLIVNGDFSLGNTGFTAGYTYSPGDIGPAGSYDVVDNPAHSRPHDINPASFGDHTTGSGLMLAANGAADTITVVWSQTVAVTPNSQYNFSLWAASWFASSPATLNIRFNGVTVGTPTAPPSIGVWQQFATIWNSAGATALTISITDTNPADIGSDFALDDISLTPTATPAGTPVGPGDIQGTALADSGDTVVVDLGNPATLGPGTYSASQFNYRFADGSGLFVTGSITPLLAVSASADFSDVRPLAIGDPITYAGPTAFISAPFGAADTFTLAAPTTVYAGFYWHATPVAGVEERDPIPYANGVGLTLGRFSGVTPPVIGAPLSSPAVAIVQQSFDFSLEVSPAPQPPAPSAITLSVSDPAPFAKPDTGQALGMFVVTRSGDLGPALQVEYATQDRTGPNGAHAGTDYVATVGTLSFAPGQATATIAVPIFGNNLFQADKTFTVSLSNARSDANLVSFAPQQTFAAGTNPYSVAVGDLNGDGKPDLIIANQGSGKVSVLLNTTPGGAATPSFAPQQLFGGVGNPQSVAVGDFNGDGRPDLAVANNGPNLVSVLLNTTPPGAATISFAPQGTFAANGNPNALAVADYNGDGKPDIAVGNGAASGGVSTVSVFLNTTAMGSTTPNFSPQQTFATSSGANTAPVGDLNGDGKPDLAVDGGNDNTVSVLLNTTPPGAATPSFAPRQTFPTGSRPPSVAAADINGDGMPDLVIANSASGTVSILLNTTPPGAASSNFAPQQTFAAGHNPTSVTIADFNGDGRPDVAVADGDFNDAPIGGSDNAISVLLNTTPTNASTASFAPRQSFPAGTLPRSLAVGDFNGDGKPDLAVANTVSGTVSVLLNTSTPITLSGSPATGTISSAPEAPATISIALGDSQTAIVSTLFATDLAVDVRDATGTLVQNVSITFTAPSSGPSGAFGNSTSVTVVTDASGRATAPHFVASVTAGSYAVTAVAVGGSTPSTNFSLTNILPASLSGTVFADFNDDGEVDFNEQGIGGVLIALSGTDDLGHSVSLSQNTDSDGRYAFPTLRPGQYSLTETQPAGYAQGINSVGTAGGTVAGDQFAVALGVGVNGLNYNYGEQPQATGPVAGGQTAGVVFWGNKKGQALLKALNGGAGTQLGDWLAATLPNLFGANAGGNNLAGKGNATVAAFFQALEGEAHHRLEAEILATALSVYVTNATLDPTLLAQRYGFTVSGTGLGTASFSVGCAGAAFGVANGTSLTVVDLLRATDAEVVNGLLYNGDRGLRRQARALYTALLQAGSIR